LLADRSIGLHAAIKGRKEGRQAERNARLKAGSSNPAVGRVTTVILLAVRLIDALLDDDGLMD